jgi:hypothetical protein
VFGRFERWQLTSDAQSWSPAPPVSAYQAVAAYAADRAAQVQPTALSGWLYVDLLLESRVHIITALVRRSVMQQMGGFDEQWATGSDYEFWLRASRTHRMVQLDACMALYRIHPKSITQRPRATNAEYLLVQRAVGAHGLSGPDGRSVPPELLQRRLHAIAFGHGYMLFWLRRRAWAHRCFTDALGHLLFHPKTWVYWLLTWPAGFKAAMQERWA